MAHSAKPNTMKAAVVQMVSGQDVDANLSRVDGLLASLEHQAVDCVVLPEMFACLGVKNQVELARTRFHASDVLARLGDWAKRLQTTLVAGSLPMLDEANAQKVRAACCVFDPQGQLIARYDKIHLFDVDVADNKGRYRESDTFSPGDGPVVAPLAVQGAQRKLGLSICYDLRFPELYQIYQAKGCELITVPSAFTYQTGQAHWEVLLRARAIETQSFVLAANQGGIHEDGRQTWGHSMIVAPNGDVLAQLDTPGDGVAIAELDFEQLKQLRQAMPIQQHKRLSPN